MIIKEILYGHKKKELLNMRRKNYFIDLEIGDNSMLANSKIDGITLKKMMITAANNLEKTKEEINAINVFPVPDGDTGVNLFLTVRTVIDQFNETEVNSVAEASQLISKGSFLGAKGNSGVIISQFFQGFSSAIEDYDEIGIKEFAEALNEGKEWAYDAVMNPQEGTILTVIKDTAEKANEIAANDGDWLEMISGTYITAVKSLENTPNLLPVLKESGVVDAGAKGFVNIWLGWCFVLMDSLGIKISHIEEEFRKIAS